MTEGFGRGICRALGSFRVLFGFAGFRYTSRVYRGRGPGFRLTLSHAAGKASHKNGTQDDFMRPQANLHHS